MVTWLGVPVSAQQTSPMDALPQGDYLGLRAPEVALPTLPQTPVEQEPQTVTPFYNPQTKQYAINGRIIEEDDAQGLLEAEALLGQPAEAGRPGNGWFNLGESRFRAITDKIKDPSLTTRFTKNFGRGVDSSQLLAGAGLQFLGAERLGKSIVDQQIEDLRRSQPYGKQFTDIQNVNDATGWFVGALGQGLPSLIESAAATIVGAGVGTAVGTPGVGTIGGGIAGFFGKGALKQQIIAAARKRAAGEALDAAEQAALKRGGQLAGAALGNALNSYRTGVSDIYSEAREQGAGPDDMGARVSALFGGIPYAALDFATDALLAGRLFGTAMSPRALPGGFAGNAAELGRRGVTGATVGGFAEGLAEMGQEAVVMASTGQALNTPEAIDRLINGFAAGWAVGSTVGGGANMLSPGKPRNLMTGEEQELDGTPALEGPQIAGLLPPPPPSPQLPGPDGVAGFLPPSETIYGEAPQSLLALTDQRPPVGTQTEMFPEQPLGTPPAPVDIPSVGAAPVAEQAPVQDVLPFESGLAPFRTEQAPQQEAEGALADNPVLRALRADLQQQQQRQTNPVLSAQRQAEFERAQAALGQVPPLSPRDRLLAESRPFELASQTALPEPEFGATPEMAASMWDQLRPKGRPKALAANLPGVQNQWVDALNMYLAGELDVDSLRTIRRELASAESAARLTRSEPRTVVTGAVTPAPSPEPTPPKPTKSKSLKKGKTDASPKPKAAALAKGKQAGSRSAAGGRDTTGATGEPAGRSAARAATETEQAPADVQDTARADDAAQPESTVRGPAEKLTPAEERGQLPTATARLDAAIEFVEEATTKTSGRDVQDAYYELLDVAFFDPTPSDDGKTRGAMQEKARKFLADTTSTWHRSYLTSAFRQQVSEAKTLDAKKEWFQFMLDKDLASAFPKKARAKVKNLDVEATPEAEPLLDTAAVRVTVDPAPEPKAVPASESLGLLTVLLQRLLTMKGMTRASWDSSANLQTMLNNSTALIGYTPVSEDVGITAVAEDLYAELTDADRKALVGGRPLSSFFDANGELRLTVSSTIEISGQSIDMLRLAADPATEMDLGAPANKVVAEQIALVDSALTEADKTKLAEHYGRDDFDAVTRAKFVADLTRAAALGLESVARAIRSIVKKVQVAVLSAAMIFSPQTLVTGNENVSIATERTDVSAPAPAGVTMSAAAQQVYQRMYAVAQERGSGFIIVDKSNARLHMFAEDGSHVASDTVLTGATREDVVNSERMASGTTLKNIKQKLTPAGTFTTRIFRQSNIEGNPLGLALNGTEYGTNFVVAIHVSSSNPIRIAALDSSTTDDNAISSGCVTMRPDFYRDKVLPVIKDFDNSLVFVIPYDETQIERLLPAEAVESESDTRPAPAAPLAPAEKRYSVDAAIEVRKKQVASRRDRGTTSPPANRVIGTGRYSLADAVPDKPSAIGAVRLKVKQFVSKLARKPKVSVFRDQADLKAKNPALYAEAKRARPEGDFDSALAAGYSFGDGKVIIFSDRIANTQHLNFVMAHEIMGHFGLRGIIPAQQFNDTMESIYQASPAIQADVDAMVERRGMSRSEATEEVLADMAGQLDTSIIARAFNAIKGALNKLGVKFGDEFPRYFLSRARAYARTGQGGVFDPAQVFGDMYQMDYVGTPISTGRFSVTDDPYSANRFAAAAARERAGFRDLDLGEIGRQFKGRGRNVQDFYDRFKSSFLSLANYRARENYGMNLLVSIINEGIKLTSGIRVRSNERNAAILNADTETKLRTSKLLYAAQEKAATAFGDGSKFKRGPALFNYSGGKWVANEAEIARLRDMGRITLAQARDGFDYDLLLPTGTVKKMRFAGIPGLTKDSVEWRGYLSTRDTIDEIALKLLEADYVASSEVQNSAFSEFAAYVDGPLTSADREMFRKIVNQYVNLKNGDLGYDDDGNPVLNINAMERAEELLEFMNKSIISKGKKEDIDKFIDILGEQMADDVVPQFRSFIKRAKIGGPNKFAIQDKIRQLGGTSAAARAADFGAKRTLATGYTPLHREGRYQIRTTVVDSQGKPMHVVDAYQSQLVYMRVANEKDAIETTRRLNEAFGDTEYEVKVFDPNTGEYVKRKGRLVAQSEVASDGVAGPLYLDYAEFIYGIEQLGIRITPEAMERAIKALTKQSSGVRKRGMSRDFVPGAEEDAIKAASIYTDRTASAIGKKVMRPKISQIMNRNTASAKAMWNSDPIMPDGRTVRSVLKDRLKNPNLAAAERADIERELDRLEFMYRKTNPEGRPGRGNQYFDEAQRTASLLEGNRDVMESDFEGGKIASQARAYTSLFQLGGSIATGALNLVTLFTNTMPYLMTYNAKNGFGGGFAVGQVVSEMHTAMMQIGVKGVSSKWNTAEFYDQIAKSKQLQDLHGLKAHEAAFIAQEIRDGVMIPAQSNALLNTARGRTDSQLERKLRDHWMRPFNLTEQASRRSAGLASFRMEYARRKEAGQSHNQAVEGARQFAIDTIELTMGEYSVHNRPPAFRTGLATMLYMYKVYPVTTVQLFSNLSPKGKLGMIAALWMLSGLQGLPFAEDLEDLIDTLMQGMGLQVGSSRLVAAQVVEDIFPGVSPYLMRGVVNSFVPADIASRTSVGNIIPGTDILLSGADVGRGLMDIAGPIPAAMLGSAQFAANITRAPFSDTISVLDTARESPVTVMRAMGDAVAYAQTDRIIDRKGATVSDDMNWRILAARVMGFYPQAAAEEYGLIRVSQRVNNYRNETTAAFRQAWVKAKLSGDNAGARQIEQSVRDWNRGAKGTGLEISDFRNRSERALKEARKPARERTLRATGKDARDEIERGMDLLSY